MCDNLIILIIILIITNARSDDVMLNSITLLLGLMPYNYICVQSGVVLSEVESMSDIFNLYTSVKLLGMAVVALLPSLLIKYIKRRSDLKSWKPE